MLLLATGAVALAGLLFLIRTSAAATDDVPRSAGRDAETVHLPNDGGAAGTPSAQRRLLAPGDATSKVVAATEQPRSSTKDSVPIASLPENADDVVVRFGLLSSLIEEHRPRIAIPENPGLRPELVEAFVRQFDELHHGLVEAQDRYADSLSGASDELTMSGADSYIVREGLTPGQFTELAAKGELEGIPRMGPDDHVIFFSSEGELRAHIIPSGLDPDLDESKTHMGAQLRRTVDALVHLLAFFQWLPEER